LKRALEVNYLKFLMRAFSDRPTFERLWREGVYRVNCQAVESKPYLKILSEARQGRTWIRPLPPARMPESEILALNNGRCAIFPGRGRTGKPAILVAACYLPFPLSHGGAVRMYNLMRGAADSFDQILVAFSPSLDSVPDELLAICSEVVVVQSTGSHDRPLTERPDTVEEFDRAEFHAALKQAIRKWKPQIVQLEFTQMAAYADDCKGARTILVEHDITLDLYGQLLAYGDDWETEREHQKWQTFERAAWRQVDCVITMSDKDRAMVEGAKRVESLINGVDLGRFQPSAQEPESARLLFIGSFAHLPNVLALDWFLKKVWPALSRLNPTLHVVAGRRPEYYLERYIDKARPDLRQPGIELEAFVSDVRPAYRRAEIVIAPLLASAGTNIKIMEAMAMGKAIVSTPGGVNGLIIETNRDVIVARDPDAMSDAIEYLITHPDRRRALETAARAAAERDYDWDKIARRQKEIYLSLFNASVSPSLTMTR
jgi:glycosyltransferase involved in cell wall biosynthesis